ncbi:MULTISPECIES: hypothetical protein [unclassified Acinetobacter]|uniref:hypothetical protein n=1 Tax=unclassified Acinetobacter TaxID=196816 RepID=UPI001F4B1FF5|nr:MULTISPECIES: hypothetical protein [unclassified Acinetobacter]MCH7353309.1 hypothetical protein [Acinetobacter sp. NIPH 2023]MCH7360691.1 hypothetical protein [Acinetobacter sp. NIPH 2024]
MSNAVAAIERFEKWFKENGKGVCKNPNYGPVPTKSNARIKQTLPSWYIANPIYPAGRYQGD